MQKTDYRFVRVTDNIEIPVPRECTAEEEQVFIAKFKAKYDLAELEKESQDLERAIKEGNVASVEELIRELELDTESEKKRPDWGANIMKEGNGNPAFRIDLSYQVLQEIKDLDRQAFTKGIRKNYRSALKQIIARLKLDPQNFGELVQKLPHLQLVIHVGSIPPLTVRFAYHENQPLVYIMKVFLASF